MKTAYVVWCVLLDASLEGRKKCFVGRGPVDLLLFACESRLTGRLWLPNVAKACVLGQAR